MVTGSGVTRKEGSCVRSRGRIHAVLEKLFLRPPSPCRSGSLGGETWFGAGVIRLEQVGTVRWVPGRATLQR